MIRKTVWSGIGRRASVFYIWVSAYHKPKGFHYCLKIGKPLLELIKFSPDFDAAYIPLITMAKQLYSDDNETSKALLIALAKVNPRRPEAAMLLDTLFDVDGREVNEL